MRLKGARSGFTLIELMVVITIMIALAALTSSAILKYIEVQQTSNTRAVLDKVQSQLGKVWSQVKDQAIKESINADTYQWIKTNLAGADANEMGRIRTIFVKLKMRQAFPMDFNEALYPPASASGSPSPCSQLQPLPAYVTYLNSHGIAMSSGLSWESSACLLMALSRGPSGINPETLQNGGAGGIDSQGYGVPVLNDAWGRPIYFTRVPSGCPVLNPFGAHPDPTDKPPYLLSYDMLDPQGYLQKPQWGTQYGPLFTSDTKQQLAPANKSYRLAPMVASGGSGKSPQPSFDPVTFAPLAGEGPIYSNP